MQQSRLKGLIASGSEGKLLKTTSFSEVSMLIGLLSDMTLVSGSETMVELSDKTGCS